MPEIPEDVRERAIDLRAEIERLEEAERKVGNALCDLLEPFLGTVEGCKAALDLAPPGYVSFRIWREIYRIDPDIEEVDRA